MRFDVITLFPPMFSLLSDYGVCGRAVRRGLVNLQLWTPRDFVDDPHRTVDDRPYGGGPGMVMKYAPLRDAIQAAKAAGAVGPVVYLTPQGPRLDQQAVCRMAQLPGMTLLCGRYEGIDERVVDALVDEEWSIGDYVLSGGELAAMVLIDATVRLLPDVLGHGASAQQDSFAGGLLDCPHYTRPEANEAGRVPEVLLSGNHANIERWREKQALGRTWRKRPDLLTNRVLSGEQRTLLEEFIREHADE
jgi:tRNA (guanine37-N1)-methyltransferase